jgi:signal transduction histidine kinase
MQTDKWKTPSNPPISVSLSSPEITQSLLRLSLTTTNAGSFLWDLKKKAFSYDKMFLSLIGIKATGPIKLDDFYSQIIPPDRALVQFVFTNKLVGRKDFPLVFRILQSNGEIRTISGRAESVVDTSGEAIALTGICTDITDSINLKEKNRQLELLEEREELIALMVHDLRNPLIGIKRIVGALLDGTNLETTKSKECLYSMMQCATQSMLNLIENVLESYLWEQGGTQIQLISVDLKDLANECITELEPISRGKSIKVTNSIANKLNVLADRMALKRVICNLLSNAIKFTPLQGVIAVQASIQSDNVCLQVIDSGFGIPKEKLDQLFNRFWQSNHRNRADGLGVGLYLCKKLIEAQNGSISCSSIISGGTTFEINLPLAPLILLPNAKENETSSGEYFSINKMRKSLSSIDNINTLKQTRKLLNK